MTILRPHSIFFLCVLLTNGRPAGWTESYIKDCHNVRQLMQGYVNFRIFVHENDVLIDITTDFFRPRVLSQDHIFILRSA